MKLKRSSNIKIAKSKRPKANTVTEPLDYQKWIEYVNAHEDFIWYEDTIDGKNSLMNIDRVPEKFKARVRASLNKVRCYLEFDEKKEHYNINVSFNSKDNWISIGFERTPKLENLRIFVEMANYLDAYLLVDGTKIIDEKVLENLGS